MDGGLGRGCGGGGGAVNEHQGLLGKGKKGGRDGKSPAHIRASSVLKAALRDAGPILYGKKNGSSERLGDLAKITQQVRN